METSVHTLLPDSFLDWMQECTMHIAHHRKPFPDYIFKTKHTITNEWEKFPFDKNQMYDQFLLDKPKMNKKVSMKRFDMWMKIFAQGYGFTPHTWRSNGSAFIMFLQ